TISRYWEEKIEAANTVKELSKLQIELQSYRVLDPACGSGNFLYIAYQQLKRVERMLLEKIQSLNGSKNKQMQMGLVTPLQFYGMDTNPFAVELARVTLMIARKIAIDNLQLTEPALPLDTLDNNILCQDALFSEWPQANAIIGNPPFLGGYRIRQELGDDYAEKVFNKFSDIKAQIDFSCYWFRLAHENIINDGRVGLVATNSISQGKNRTVSLDYITQNGGYINEAISTQIWSGEANVYVSIVNWSKIKPQICYLDDCRVKKITSSLTSTIDVSSTIRLKANLNKSFVGVQPNGKGFFVNEEQTQTWIKAYFKNQDVLKQSISAQDLTDNPHGKPERWIIDFQNMSIEEVSEYKLPLEYVKTNVKPERETNRETVMREKWWRFKRTNEAMRSALSTLPFYFIVPRHSKWFIFIPGKSDWLPADSTTVIASDDFYILGILTSNIHRVWVKAQSSTLEDRTRYTHNTCFETFPFPQTVDIKLVQQIRTKTEELHEYRSQQMETKQWGITT
ncbi:MAG: class I SAM-dependent DNA methyltransferase, partial [Dolichospermum sp.]